MAKAVGLSRSLKIEWLDKTVHLVLEGKSESDIKDELNEYLSYEIASPTNLRKTRELLMNLWVYSDESTDQIRREALTIFRSCANERTALHWCMLLLQYPVFVDVCGLIGKLTNIQETFSTSWLKERLFDEWGERTTLLHSSDKILQTLKYLNAIENQSVGNYRILRHPVTNGDAKKVIVKTILSMKQKAYYEVADLSSVPQLFPFSFDITHEFIYNAGCFELGNFGGKTVIVS